MMVAKADGKDGRKLLVVGLSEENVRRLKNDEPIERPLEVVGLDDWTLYILGPEDMQRFAARSGVKLP